MKSVLLIVLSSIVAATAAFGVDVDGLGFEALASLDSPVAITHAGDGRLFVTLQGGRVVIYNTNSERRLPQPFLDIGGRVSAGGEGGLLSIAFHPDYPANGFFFVNYTDAGGDTVIARFSVSADRNVADASSEAVLLEIPQPFSNHNGGQLQFGPDGFLYAAMGDGGAGNDPGCRAQDGSSLHGKMLRLDVDQNAGAPPFHAVPASNPFVGDGNVRDEVWALGLRNPWRFSFDRATGDMYIADVGQSQREEVDLQPAASGGGENYGWKVMEGFLCTGNTGGCGLPVAACNDPSYTLPIIQYDHRQGRCSVTGGYVYRGGAIPQLAGAYVYGDFCTGEVWAAEQRDGGWESSLLEPTIPFLTTFGEDAAGEIYAAASGTLFRLTGPAGGGCPVAVGHPRYCTECGPCAEGEGGCRGDDQCAEGLVCAENFGASFGLPRTADVCLTARSLPLPPYNVTELPAVTAGDVAFDALEARAINNAGQVTGHAFTSDPGDSSRVAFRFSPDGGMEALDPRGNFTSRGKAINEGGDVFGVLNAPGGGPRNGVFVHREGSGFDLLENGSSGVVRRFFEIFDMNEAGDLVGSLRPGLANEVPYLYLASDGWQDLSTLDPRLREAPTRAFAVNERGDVLLRRRGLTPEGFLVHGGEVFDLARPASLPAAINDAGRAVGGVTVEGSSHAFVLPRPDAALIDIHPRKFTSSSAFGVTAKGVVGAATGGAFRDTLFTWDQRRSPKTKLQARRVDFDLMLIERFNFLFRLHSLRMNERLELVGGMTTFDLVPELNEGFFYFAPAYGLFEVDDLLAAAGSDDVTVEVIDFNDWGALLLRVDGDAGERVVVLAPDEN